METNIATLLGVTTMNSTFTTVKNHVKINVQDRKQSSSPYTG